MEDRITGVLQENILVLLCFSDDHHALVRNMVDSNLFESRMYRNIANRAVEYIDKYDAPPKEHLPDLFEDILDGKDEDEADMYSETFSSIYQSREEVNADYVLSQISLFIRQQRLKLGILEAVDAVKSGDYDLADTVLAKATTNSLEFFNPGTFLTDSSSSLRFLDEQSSAFKTGIDELDIRGYGPTRKELFLVMAPPKGGKTQWLVSLGKAALLQRLKVLHITLEMGEDKMAQRYIQSLWSITKRDAPVKITNLSKNTKGVLVDLKPDLIKDRPSLDMPDIRKILKNNLAKVHNRFNLLVKQFPTSQFSIKQLTAYLDALEKSKGFVPDLLIVDYADLMEINSRNIREDTGRLYKELRGVAVSRNIAIATATQTNRAGASSRLITSEHVAEDYSKIHTADCVLTYNQTQEEQEMSLARIYVAAGRNDEDGFSILISQAYAMGQFFLESSYIDKDYWDYIGEEED